MRSAFLFKTFERFKRYHRINRKECGHKAVCKKNAVSCLRTESDKPQQIETRKSVYTPAYAQNNQVDDA